MSRRTIVVFVLLLLLLVPLVVGIAETSNAFGLPEPISGVIFGGVLIPLVGVAAYFVWRAGFYAVRDNVPQTAVRDHSITIVLSEPGSLRLLFVAVIAVGLIAFMTSQGRNDLILTLDKRMIEGRITAIRAPTPGVIRMSDYQITYKFKTDLGSVYSGEDVLPPKYPPPEDGRIIIAYCRHDPSVSRIASRLSAAPIAGVLFGLGVLLWSLTQFVRQRRRLANISLQTRQEFVA